MREIKFRAIHKSTLKKWYTDELYFHDGKWFENYRALDNYFPINLEQCVVLQYTGLTDKNGIEIYEGDVIICEGYRGYYVSFKEGCFALEYLDTITRAIHYARVTPINHIRTTEWEVIGNIYEHPHLMELDRK